MEKNEIKKENVTLKNETKNEFKRFDELTTSEMNRFETTEVKFTKRATKRGNLFSVINFRLHDRALQEVEMTKFREKIDMDTFDLISMTIGLDDRDSRGYIIDRWNRLIPTRFVKGISVREDGSENEYYSCEFYFGKDLVITHFFTPDQSKLINILESKYNHKFNWVIRPDRIKEVVTVEI